MTAQSTEAQDRSAELFARAIELMPGGVNSPVRAFRGVGGTPRFIRSAQGATMTDVDGRTYIDYVGSWGPMILGHADPEVVDALRAALGRGTSYGAPTELEVEMAEEIVDAVPSVEMVRMVNSGTEATMSALRLARGATGRNKIVKFEGCYHGHGDSLLVKAGSGVATLGLPDSPGVPAPVAQNTITAPYNDPGALEQIFSEAGAEIAAVIIEPVVGNMGCVPPRDGYLQSLRDITTRHGALLIFDEVMTGFRLARGGAQELYGITPDLTTLGKIIGGGLPVGAYGGRREIMDLVAPSGPVYQAGTLSGNPLAMAAGLATLRQSGEPGFYERLEELGEHWRRGMREAASAGAVPFTINQVGSMVSIFFTGGPVTGFATAAGSDTEVFRDFYWHMISRGIYLAPSQYEAGFISAAHSEEDFEKTFEAAREWFAKTGNG